MQEIFSYPYALFQNHPTPPPSEVKWLAPNQQRLAKLFLIKLNSVRSLCVSLLDSIFSWGIYLKIGLITDVYLNPVFIRGPAFIRILFLISFDGLSFLVFNTLGSLKLKQNMGQQK